MNDDNSRSIKIGELLINLGVLTSGDLTEAIQIAKRMGVPIGRVLVMSGCVTEINLQQALELQSLLKDGLVDLELGCNALRMSFQQNITLQEALKKLNWAPKQTTVGNKLGDLLVDSAIVTSTQLERALEASFQSGMPLGGTLVLQGVISAQLLPTVLHVQEQIRDGKVPREQAIDDLKRALMFWARAEQSKQDELQALQASGAKPLTAGSPKSTSRRSTLKAKSVTAAQAAAAQAAQQQQQEQAQGIPVYGAPAAQSTAAGGKISLIELLKLSGTITQSGLEKAINQALNDPRLCSKLLVAVGIIDNAGLNNFIQIQALIAKGTLKTDQGLYVLSSIRYRHITLEKALSEIGITANT